MPDLTFAQWLLAIVGAMAIGVSKSGFAGVALVNVIVFAFLFGARDSTGIVLPMLIAGDMMAIGGFYRHVKWEHLWRTLPPAFVGIGLGALLMHYLSAAAFTHVLGWILLGLTVLQILRMISRRWAALVPHGRVLAWSLGLLAGMTTMLANAGAPVMTLYLLTLGVAKLEFTGTIAAFFFAVNVFKVPFSIALGLIRSHTLLLNVVLLPAILAGLLGGRWLLKRVPQRLFDGLLLTFAGIAALRLIGLF